MGYSSAWADAVCCTSNRNKCVYIIMNMGKLSRRQFLRGIAASFLAHLPKELMMSEEIYNDPDQPVAARARDLVSRMSLEEKVSQMGYGAPAIERLGIP